MAIGNYTIHGRDAKPVADAFKVENFPYKTLMGDWMIVGSSLPLWKARSDVLCRYTPHTIPGEGGSKEVSFSDEIWWEQLDKKTNKHQPRKGADRAKRSIVRGRNKIDPKGVNGASYVWRGYNFLKPFTSHWQLVAYNDRFIKSASEDTPAAATTDNADAEQSKTDEPIWLVTYFTATLFTEAGIDLYVRGTLSDAQYEEIVEALKNFQGDSPAAKELRELANKMFRVPVGNI